MAKPAQHGLEGFARVLPNDSTSAAAHRRRDGGGDAGAGVVGDAGVILATSTTCVASSGCAGSVASDLDDGADPAIGAAARCWRRNSYGYAPTSLPWQRSGRGAAVGAAGVVTPAFEPGDPPIIHHGNRGLMIRCRSLAVLNVLEPVRSRCAKAGYSPARWFRPVSRVAMVRLAAARTVLGVAADRPARPPVVVRAGVRRRPPDQRAAAALPAFFSPALTVSRGQRRRKCCGD